MQGPNVQSRAHFSRALVPAESAPWAGACGGGWVVFHCGLKLSIYMLALGPPGWYRWRLTAVCALLWGHLAWAMEWSEDGCYLYWAWRCLEGAKLWTKAICCWVWGHLARSTGHTKARCCLFRVCEPLRRFRKVYNISQDKLFVWKSHRKQLGWAHKLGGVGSQNHQC